MDSFTIRCAVGEWQRLTTKVMDKKVIKTAEWRGAIDETYRILTAFCGVAFVPKEIAELIVSMDEFLWFATLIEGNEEYPSFGMDTYRQIHAAVFSLKSGFFDGEYPCPYPLLQVTDNDRRTEIWNREKEEPADDYRMHLS